MAPTDQFLRSKVYRDRAEECRSIAERYHGFDTREKLLNIAREFDHMAMQAAGLELQQAELEPTYRKVH
jgi:hypothetical protein